MSMFFYYIEFKNLVQDDIINFNLQNRISYTL